MGAWLWLCGVFSLVVAFAGRVVSGAGLGVPVAMAAAPTLGLLPMLAPMAPTSAPPPLFIPVDGIC